MGSGLSDIASGVSAVKNLFPGGGDDGAPPLNPSGGFQPTDINQPPSGTPGVVGVAPGMGADATSSASSGATRKPSALQQGIGSGLQQGLTAYDQAQQSVNRSARPTNFLAPAPASVNGYGTPQPVQVPTLFTLGNVPRSAFFGG